MVAMDNKICHVGGSYGIRIIITTGEVNGMIEAQNAKLPCGSLIIAPNNMIENISGKVIGSWNCCASESLSTAEPTAANKEP